MVFLGGDLNGGCICVYCIYLYFILTYVLFIVFLLVCIVLVYCIVLEVLECFDLFSFYSGGSAETGPNVKQDKTRLCKHQSRSDSDLEETYRILLFLFKKSNRKSCLLFPPSVFFLGGRGWK